MIRPVTRCSEREGKELRCYSTCNPHYYKDGDGNLQPIEMDSRDAESGVGDIQLRDKGVTSVGIRKDANHEKFLGLRPDEAQQSGAEQLEFTIQKITYNGEDQVIDTSKNEVLDPFTTDLGNIIVRSTRNQTTQLFKANNTIRSFEIKYKLHLRGLQIRVYKGEYWFYADNVFRFKIVAPKLLDLEYNAINTKELDYPFVGDCSKCGVCCRLINCPELTEDNLCKLEGKDKPRDCVRYPLPDATTPEDCTLEPAFITPNLYAPVVEHSMKDNGDGTYTYTKKSNTLFTQVSPYLPASYYIDADIYYSTTADGWVYNQNATGWQECIDDTDGDSSSSTGASSTLATYVDYFSKGGYSLRRSFFYFDTSAATNPDSASINIYGVTNGDTRVSVQQGTQDATLSTNDYNNFSGTYWGRSASMAGWNTAGYNSMTLNAAGIAAINTSGETLVCAREYNYDYLNVEWLTTDSFANGCYYSDNSGTAQDPYIEITEATNWAHDYDNVPNVAIGSISGVPIANIGEVNDTA